MKKNATIITVLLLLFSLACGTSRRAPTIVKPIANMRPAVAEGEHAFMEHCNKCHPGGTAGLGPALNNKSIPGFLIKFQVRNGLGAMPAFNKNIISKEELDKIVAYLKAIRKNEELRETAAPNMANRE